MTEWTKRIDERLLPFKNRYYLSQLLRGSMLSAGVILSYVLFASFSEHFLWLNSFLRLIVLAAFIGLLVVCWLKYLREPLLWYLFKRGMDNEIAAKIIGKSDQQVDDQLLNMLQLSKTVDSPLAEASLRQKFVRIGTLAFEKTIDLRLNKKYLPWLVVPTTVLIAVLLINSTVITGSTTRILNFSETYVPQAPFDFQIQNQELKGYMGEDFELLAGLEGGSLPDELFVEQNGMLRKMVPDGKNQFRFIFSRIQKSQEFRLYAAGYYSGAYKIEIKSRPELSGLSSELIFPSYLGMRSQKIDNAGNLEVPEGTTVKWKISTRAAQEASIKFGEGMAEAMNAERNEWFSFQKVFRDDSPFEIRLKNDFGENKDVIGYDVKVIKDEFPKISVRNAQDSVFFKAVYLGGDVSDDHGIQSLKVFWRKSGIGIKELEYRSYPIQILPGKASQEFIQIWSIDSLSLAPGDRLEYYLQVWDNDGVNGNKSTRSEQFVLMVPGKRALDQQIKLSESRTKEEIKTGSEQVKTLSKLIEEAQQKLRGKQSLDWQDKAMMEDILKQKNDLEKALQELSQENKLLNDKRTSFDEQDERIKEKTEQLQKLMDELLDEETKKLFGELEKLLRENAKPEQMQKLLDKIQRNEINLEKELDRIKELFKQLQLESKIDQSLNRLKESIKNQEKILKETLDGNEKGEEKKSEQDQLAEQQKALEENLGDEKLQMEDIRKTAEELGEDDSALPEDSDFDSVQEEMKKSEQELKGGDSKKSGESQKKAIQKMKEMEKNLSNMQSAMQMEMDMANLESLRQILHGMLKLSFDEEQNMKEFSKVNTADPDYLRLSQYQLKLQDDAKVLEDSLMELGKKDMALGSFVTREIGELNHHLDRSTEFIRERKKSNASAEMQLSMTSMNNLSLMLNDHFQMMMEMMSKPGKGKGKKKGKNPGLAEMQRQLNEQIEQIKNGQKGGRELSEELARMAAEQERIRKALQNLQEKLDEQNGQIFGGDIPAKMEQTEIDLVNKQITEQTIRRQKEILTRLLEAEKSMREQEMDPERKGETAKDYEKDIPKAFREYLRMKERESELLRSVPLKMYPYYKKEAEQYLQRLGKQF